MPISNVIQFLFLSEDIMLDLVHPLLYSTLFLMVLQNVCALVPAFVCDDPRVATEQQGLFICNYFTTFYYVDVRLHKRNEQFLEENDPGTINCRACRGNSTRKKSRSRMNGDMFCFLPKSVLGAFVAFNIFLQLRKKEENALCNRSISFVCNCTKIQIIQRHSPACVRRSVSKSLAQHCFSVHSPHAYK